MSLVTLLTDFGLSDSYVAEVMSIIEAQPEATEIQVEQVKFLRYAEARGDYEQVVAMLNGMAPHGNVTAAILGAELGTIVSNGEPATSR